MGARSVAGRSVVLPGVSGFGSDLLGTFGAVAEQGCDDGRGCLEDEFAQCPGTAGGIRDAEVLEAEPDTGGLDRMPGEPAGEQPGAVRVRRGWHPAGSGDQMVADHGIEGDRDGHWCTGEGDGEVLVGVGDVVQPEREDAMERLGVQQDQGGDDPFVAGQGGVVEYPAQHSETLFLADHGGG